MKFIYFGLISVLVSFTANAQLMTSLSQNFDVSCVVGTGFPGGWSNYNPISGTYPLGAWQCTSADGKSSTPGMMCTGVYNAVYNLDTSYLITPPLNVSSYTGKIFLNFDCKTSRVRLGGRMDIMLLNDSMVNLATIDSDITEGARPTMGINDSIAWVTHQIDLSGYKGLPSFYISFRYTSNTDSGSIWYLDNINTSVTDLNVPTFIKGENHLSIIGNSTSEKISYSISTLLSGSYYLSLYDMVGREVHHQNLYISSGTTTHTIDGLNLSPGIYYMKVGNGDLSSVARVSIR